MFGCVGGNYKIINQLIGFSVSVYNILVCVCLCYQLSLVFIVMKNMFYSVSVVYGISVIRLLNICQNVLGVFGLMFCSVLFSSLFMLVVEVWWYGEYYYFCVCVMVLLMCCKVSLWLARQMV